MYLVPQHHTEMKEERYFVSNNICNSRYVSDYFSIKRLHKYLEFAENSLHGMTNTDICQNTSFQIAIFVWSPISYGI